MDGLRLAADALRAAETGLSVTADNLANLQTPGFRASSVQLQTGPGGRGVEVGAVSPSMSPGPVALTGRALDLAIEGGGHFAVRDASGRLAFTRDGSFQVDALGRVVHAGGALLDPPITVPPDASAITVGRDGAVTATDSQGATRELGRIATFDFANPSGLSSIGSNLEAPTAASGPGVPVDRSVRSGALELSNTDVANEMVQLIRDERYSRVGVVLARTEDEQLGTVLDLKR